MHAISTGTWRMEKREAMIALDGDHNRTSPRTVLNTFPWYVVVSSVSNLRN